MSAERTSYPRALGVEPGRARREDVVRTTGLVRPLAMVGRIALKADPSTHQRRSLSQWLRRKRLRSGVIVSTMLTCVVCIAACGLEQARIDNSAVARDVGEASANSVEDRFLDRAELPSCGEVVIDQGERVRLDPDLEPVRCLTTAMGQQTSAELRLQYLTVEGEPIIRYYRALSDGPFEMYINSTADSYTNVGWTYIYCPHAIDLGNRGDCTSRTSG